MREIKFRAFDKLNKKIVTSGLSINLDTTDRVIPISFSQGDLSYCRDNDVSSVPNVHTDIELMQWTGLKDKNGREIYEGDIVTAASEGQKGIFEVKWRQEASPSYILFPAWQDKKIWHISATEHYKGKQFIGIDAKIETTEKEGYYDEGLEVIGNIYENPELLT